MRRTTLLVLVAAALQAPPIAGGWRLTGTMGHGLRFNAHSNENSNHKRGDILMELRMETFLNVLTRQTPHAKLRMLGCAGIVVHSCAR